ncbi:minor capsid protein [Lysinibacillus sp. 54212]|uniref:minor capsid protein n=1 Tax=Lysinibacillus sp. 54212 TaxID=3119829 RepID=UPI002FC7033C
MAKQPPANKLLDAKVLARRQKDLDGFIEKHQAILDVRAAKYATEITPLWERIKQNITKEIKAIYNEVQDAQGVPIVKQPIDEAKMRNMRRQIARLGKLEQQLVEMLGTDQQKTKLDRNLAYSYAESYYLHAFGLEQATKVAVNVPILTVGHVIGALINPWLPDGNTYSDRLRANTQYLAKKMVVTVENALGSGWSINRTAREIQNHTQEGYYNAVRLARTEINRAAAQGANHTYLQNADILDGKRWNAVLDARTAPKDAQNDGQIFELDYDTPENPGEAGKRIPNHPNCRCKWSPVLSALGVSTKERIARGKGDDKTNFGENIYTKARSYKEYAAERGLPNIDDLVRNENPIKYLRRGETLADIPKNFFDPFQPVKIATKVFTAVEAAKIAVIDNAFVPAATIAEANKWAAENIPQVKTVDYKGYDLALANEVNEELYKLFQLYPEIEDINFIGTAQARNKAAYERLVADFLKANSKTFEGLEQKTIDYFVKRHVRKPSPIPSNTYAQAANNTWKDQAGITFNQKWAKDYKALSQSVIRDVESKWHPEGTEKPVSILVHEFGHSVDYFLDKIGLRDKYITPITKAALKDKNLGNDLSRYATKNHREVVAEAFAEYRLNPNPRKWARKIGEAIEQALDEYRKGR